MLNKMFRHVDLLEKGLDVAWLRQETIAQNIANADTPDYKAKHVEFETVFRQALEDNGASSLFDTSTTNSRHMKFSTSDPLEVMPSVVSETHLTERMDGNNVDPDQQMTLLAENTIQYDTLIQKTSGELARLKIAITGSR